MVPRNILRLTKKGKSITLVYLTISYGQIESIQKKKSKKGHEFCKTNSSSTKSVSSFFVVFLLILSKESHFQFWPICITPNYVVLTKLDVKN